MIHIVKNACHDESEVWCGEGCVHVGVDATHTVEEATCSECLRLAGDYGGRAHRRMRALVDLPGSDAERDAQRVYQECIDSGLSDAEARGTAWPEVL